MKFARKYSCEPGRHIALDGRSLLYVNIVRESRTEGYAIAPWEADGMTHLIVKLLNDYGYDNVQQYLRDYLKR